MVGALTGGETKFVVETVDDAVGVLSDVLGEDTNDVVARFAVVEVVGLTAAMDVPTVVEDRDE